jgi:hypothetical protein
MGGRAVVETIVSSTDLVAAFKRLREHWKGLFESVSGSGGERARVLADVDRDLATVTAAARVSEEARSFVEVAYRVRMGEWQQPGFDYSPDVAESAEGVRASLEMRLRTLRQMESGDEVLPDSGRDIRRSAARDVCFFNRLRQLSAPDAEEGAEARETPDARDVDLARLSQCFDGRRKMVREEINVPSAAVEAVEFLVRLGASG